ncbi:ABC transporter permease [Micromonospora sp. NPDC048830]|uniref:ABC transporter permease n=1 Tax=Micromonospora sp. NPDC048830 TaxID=3364257 RepID=UPI00372346A9
MSPFDAALLGAAVALAVPILLPALGELISQRAGVMNVGLEGMMLFGAFFGFLFVERTGSPWLGLLAGTAGGMSLALVMAILSVTFRADQIVVGVGINLIGAGVTIFLNRELFLDRGQVSIDRMGLVSIPVLSDIPGVGKPLFDQTIVTYLTYLLIPAIAWALYRSRWGLAVRGSGELPEAVETAGINVNVVRYSAVLTAGLLAGLAGAFLTVVQVGIFVEGMTGGRGFLALAAVVFGKWTLRGTIGAAMLFGAADALQLRLQNASEVPGSVWYVLATIILAIALVLASRRGFIVKKAVPPIVIALIIAAIGVSGASLTVPAQLWLALPYLLSLAALAGLVGHARVPTALADPFDRKAI